MKQIINRLKRIDKWILLSYLGMTLFSIIMVYSASSYTAEQTYGDPMFYFKRQVVFVLISYVVMFVVTIFPFRVLKNKKMIQIAFFILIILLVTVLFFGREINGARRWISLGGFNLQPAELAKIGVIWYLAYILSKRQTSETKSFLRSMVAPLILIVGVLFLIFLQPDTGTTIIILAVATTMILSSGLSPKYGIGFGLLSFAGYWGTMTVIRRFGQYIPLIRGYRYERFLAYWDPFSLSDSHGLQLVNSYYALARGGVLGVGLGNSVQKTGYLPFPYTDFILAIVGEELGLIGILILLFVYMFLISRIYLIGIRTTNSFNSILSIGIATLFLVQGFFNIAGVVGVLPITGLTFPFISYGGTSLIIMSVAVGLALNVSSQK